MASQLFDSSVPTVERANSGRAVSKSADDIAVKTLKQEPTSPLHYADDGSRDFSGSPEKAYHVQGQPLATSTAKKAKKEEDAKKKDKKAKKEKKKADKKKEKKLKKAKKSGVDVSSASSSSSSLSDAEVEVVVGAAKDKDSHGKQPHPKATTHITAPTNQEKPKMVEQQQKSAGPYIPANDSLDGRVIREEKVEQVYRIAGSGVKVPQVDPTDASLSGTLSKLTPKTTANVKMVDETVLVRENAPIPQAIKESSLPHTTVHTWHETTEQPETVTTQMDEHGNVVRRTVVKSEQVKHTVKTQSYQTYAVDENTPPAATTSSAAKSPPPPPQRSDHLHSSNGTNTMGSVSPVETHSRTIAFENGIRKQQGVNNGASEEFNNSDLVSTKAVTTGNRTVETLTYKKEKEGVVETHVEHRITIHSGEEIDHDAELSRAILEATNMNPEMTVEKVEVKQERH